MHYQVFIELLYVSGTLPDVGDIEVNETDKVYSQELKVLLE